MDSKIVADLLELAKDLVSLVLAVYTIRAVFEKGPVCCHLLKNSKRHVTALKKYWPIHLAAERALFLRGLPPLTCG